MPVRSSSSTSPSSPHPPLPVTIPAHTSLTHSQINAFPPFATWLRTLRHSLSLQSSPTHPFHACPYALQSITIKSAIHFGSRLGFLLLQATITNAEHESLPGVVFLRGSSVAIMLVLTEAGGDGEEWVVLTVQARIPIGQLECVELPAGMLDEASTFAGAAAKEIQEECGIKIEANELVDLTQLALGGVGAEEGGEGTVYPSPGGCDEGIKVFLCRHEVEAGKLGEWRGRLTGLRDHGEKITLKLVKLKDLWKETRDAKALSAVALYEGLKREGRV